MKKADLLFLIGAASASDDLSDSAIATDAATVDSVIEDLDAPLTDTVSEDASATVYDTSSSNINANSNVFIIDFFNLLNF